MLLNVETNEDTTSLPLRYTVAGLIGEPLCSLLTQPQARLRPQQYCLNRVPTLLPMYCAKPAPVARVPAGMISTIMSTYAELLTQFTFSSLDTATMPVFGLHQIISAWLSWTHCHDNPHHHCWPIDFSRAHPILSRLSTHHPLSLSLSSSRPAHLATSDQLEHQRLTNSP